MRKVGVSCVKWAERLRAKEASSWGRNGDLPSAGGVTRRRRKRQSAKSILWPLSPQVRGAIMCVAPVGSWN